MLFESLRQKCIYEVLSDEKDFNANYTKWFNYVLKFIDYCDETESYARNCSLNVMKEVGIDGNAVERCITNSFVKEGGKVVDNRLLKEDKEWA